MAGAEPNELTHQRRDHRYSVEEADLRHLWNVVARRKWPILGFAFATGLLTAVIALRMTPIYQASATVLIESQQANVLSIEEVYGLDTRNQQYYETQYGILSSRPLAENVIGTLDLISHPEFGAADQDSDSKLDWRSWFPFARAKPSGTKRPDLTQAAIWKYSSKLVIQPVPKTQLVHVHFESEEPALAARIANAHAQAYIDSILQARVAVTESAGAWMTERLGDLERELRESEQELQAYRESEQLIDVEGLKSLPSRQINDLALRLAEVRQTLAQAEIAYLQVKQLENAPLEELQDIPAILENEGARRFQQAEASAKQKVAELEDRYGPLHPVMIAAQSQLTEATQNLNIQRSSVAAAIRNGYEAAKSEEKALLRALNIARQQYQDIGRKESGLNALQQAVDTRRQLYELFYNRISETGVTGELESNYARIISPAVPPQFPAKPNKKRMVSLAVALALFLGVMLAFLFEALDNTVKSAADVEEKLNLPLLGMLPLLKARGKQQKSLGNVFFDKDETAFNEAIRGVRTSISLDNLERPHKVIVVSSSIGGEGKSTFALNLAHAFAQLESVLLLDTDFRRPSIAREIRQPSDVPGLSELLAGKADLAECIFRGEQDNVDVLAPGFVVPDPLQLLSSRRLGNALMVLRKRYDRIIIDTPPVLPVSDALIVSKLADAVIFVVKSDSTSIRKIQHGLDQLARVNAHVTGIVVNQLDIDKAEKYSDYGYGGYYESYESRPSEG